MLGFSKYIGQTSMNLSRYSLLLFIVSLLLSGGYSTRILAHNPSESLSPLVKRLTPSVVNLRITNNVNTHSSLFRKEHSREYFEQFFGEQDIGPEWREKGLGSGFVISPDGYIVTSNHLIRKANSIEVVLEGGEKYSARIIGTAPMTDLALLKIDSKEPLPAVKIGDSSTLEIGDWVFAIGNPFGLRHIVTTGIVSAKEKSVGFGPYDNFIQTDAAINPGNSGGPLFDSQGKVVGVNTTVVAYGKGLGFVMPINMVKDEIDQLKEHERVKRGWFGLQVQDITPEMSDALGIGDGQGALVSYVKAQSPADNAGIRRGDVIVSIDGEKISEASEFVRKFSFATPKKDTRFVVIRNGKEKIFVIKPTEQTSERAQKQAMISENKSKLGIKVAKITQRLKSKFNLATSQGVIITKVEPESREAKAGLAIGDAILEINGKAVSNVKRYNDILIQSQENGALLFLVERRGIILYISVRTSEGDGG